jgi:hypothetical protein
VPTTIQHVKENLCAAHIYALAASAGTDLGQPHVHDYGVDGFFEDVLIRGVRRFSSGFPLQFQAKASTKWEIKNGVVIYDLESKTFNDLVTRTAAQSTMILILLCLSRAQADWHVCTSASTTLQHCCYWHIPSGDPVPNEESTKRIFIPTAQLLTPTVLRELVDLEKMRRELQAS